MKLCIVCMIHNKWYTLSLPDRTFYNRLLLTQGHNYVSFQIVEILRELKARKKKKVPVIIDLESMSRQFQQIGKDMQTTSKWHILTSLKSFGLIDSSYRLNNIENFLNKLADFYYLLSGSNAEEQLRFENLELKINRIIHQIQLNGIRVSKEIVASKCAGLERYLYFLKNQLQYDYSVFTPEDRKVQLDFLKAQKIKILNSVYDTFKLNKTGNKGCEIFYELIRTANDLKSLLHILGKFGGEDYTHPYFVGFGTITSRITLRSPALQNLRKINRDIIVPRENYRFIYVDYSQFEAGILASLSGDEKLVRLYNEGLIYDDIAKNVLENDNRENAKLTFYRFLYGDDFKTDSKVGTRIREYFSQFKQLEAFRQRVIDEANNTKYVISINGNYRKIDEKNDNVWILSHKIQSTASFIFKTALTTVYDEVQHADLILPLHDGALYEVHQALEKSLTIKIVEIFERVFKNTCPNLNTKVNVKDFFENFQDKRDSTLVDVKVVSINERSSY